MERQGNIQLYLAGTSELFNHGDRTVDGRGQMPAPWRSQNYLRITEGLCPDQETTPAGRRLRRQSHLLGAANSQHALIVRFDQNHPTIEYVPMIERALRSTATIFNVDLSRLPRAESRDRRDQIVTASSMMVFAVEQPMTPACYAILPEGLSKSF